MSKLGRVVTWNQDIDYIHPPANGDLPTIQEISNAFANVTADMLWVSAYDAINNPLDSEYTGDIAWPEGYTINATAPVTRNHLNVRNH
jgi:hypothetical protein